MQRRKALPRPLCTALALGLLVLLGGCGTGATARRTPQAETGAQAGAPAEPVASQPAVAGVDLQRCAQIEPPLDRPLTKKQRLARVHLGLGSGYLEQRAFDIALGELRQSIALDSKLADAHGLMGLLLFNLGNVQEADAAYRKALALAPSNANIHNNYGVFLCAQGQLETADAHFRCALANPLYETPQLAYANAAECELQRQRTTEARRDLEAAIQLAPTFPSPYLSLARVQLQQGDAAGALRSYEHYAKLTAPSADALALAISIANALGDQDRAGSYTLLLRNRFPDSAAARALEQP